jgi:hypothetical protein
VERKENGCPDKFRAAFYIHPTYNHNQYKTLPEAKSQLIEKEYFAKITKTKSRPKPK